MHLSTLLQASLFSSAIASQSYRQRPIRSSKRIVQEKYPVRSADYDPNADRAEAVHEMFTHAWTGYKTYAFPNDELLPVSDSFSNSR